MLRGLKIPGAGPRIGAIGTGRAGNVDKQKELGVNLALQRMEADVFTSEAGSAQGGLRLHPWGEQS